VDICAYVGGFQAYLWFKKRRASMPISFELNLWIFVGCIFGALAGAKLLAWAEMPDFTWQALSRRTAWVEGKTIVGALLGAWAGIEIAKKILGVAVSTGDLFVFPLLGGMAVGRIGCFLTGLADHTHGVPSTLPWAVDYGDGIGRHPTQIYEIIFLAALVAILWPIRSRFRTEGILFRVFMICYLAMRLGIEFIKPRDVIYFGLSPIQWACLLALPVCTASMVWLAGRNREIERHA
jgi:prolipoprotein diacylglyceryltransferase